MLGEVHDIAHEFPEYHDRIEALLKNDPAFAALLESHDNVDARIRELEEKGQPVADETMEDLKKERALAKDRIYDILRHAAD